MKYQVNVILSASILQSFCLAFYECITIVCMFLYIKNTTEDKKNIFDSFVLKIYESRTCAHQMYKEKTHTHTNDNVTLQFLIIWKFTMNSKKNLFCSLNQIDQNQQQKISTGYLLLLYSFSLIEAVARLIHCSIF